MAFGYSGIFLGVIDSSIIVIGAVFLIFFAFINYILSKVFRDPYGNVNRATTGIISFSMAALIVYFGNNLIYDIVNGFNIAEGTLTLIIMGVFLIFAILIIRKLRFGGFLAILGAGLIIVGFTNLVYRTGVVIIAGAVLLFIGGLFLLKKRKPKPYDMTGPPDNYSGYAKKLSDLGDKQKYKHYKRYGRLDWERKKRGI